MSLPAWLAPLPDPAEQRALDQWAIDELGAPGLTLMERAGAGLARLTTELTPSGPVAVVCGKGNNGGDGLVAARLLREQGRDVRVLTLAPVEELRGDARTNYDRLEGSPPQPFAPGGLAGSLGIVDAILGTGFSGVPRGPAADAIAAINAAAAVSTVVACDIPSGVDGATGEVSGQAVRASATATFHAAKPGLWINPGKAHAGEIRVIDIGIPPGGPARPEIGLIGDEVLGALPRRGADSTKFAAGSVLVCGGSAGLTGAPSMACEAAMRAGAGYVTAAVPASLNQIFEIRLLEVMSVPLPDRDGALLPAALEPVLERSERVQALALGPGLGREPDTVRFVRELAQRAEVALVLDADGLNAHAGRLESLARRSSPTVLTPHAGELARLLEQGSPAVGAHRLSSVRTAATRAQAIVVLKGDDTLVADPGGRVAISRGGAPALATAGTGDVLTGVISAFLAKRVDPFCAACAGVHVHARAGRIAGREIGPEGVIARDVIQALPRALG
ncbi:MAG: NAD(P)H-hydrate dehydratase [Solirubrobacteraceae bacterium]